MIWTATYSCGWPWANGKKPTRLKKSLMQPIRNCCISLQPFLLLAACDVHSAQQLPPQNATACVRLFHAAAWFTISGPATRSGARPGPSG